MAKVTTQTKGHVFTITLSRPEKRNCVDGETAKLLQDAWIRFRDDDRLFVAVLTGAGDEAFCAGADLSALDTLGPPPGASPAEVRRFVTSGPGYMGYTRQTDIFKPIVAAINGHALAGGLELACLADMRVVAEHAQMGVACRRWNVPLVTNRRTSAGDASGGGPSVPIADKSAPEQNASSPDPVSTATKS